MADGAREAEPIVVGGLGLITKLGQYDVDEQRAFKMVMQETWLLDLKT